MFLNKKKTKKNQFKRISFIFKL